MKIATLLVFTFLVTAAYSQNTWTNGNGTGLWSDDLNWSEGAIPNGFEAVIFDGTSTDDCLIDLDPGMSGLGFTMASTYTGIITVDNGVTFECGIMTLQGGTLIMGDGSFICSGFNMSGSSTSRVFDGTNSSQITISGNLNTGTATSTFKAAANTENGTTLSGTYGGTGVFVHNSGKFRFSAAATRALPNGVTFYQLDLFNSISGNVQFTLGTTVTVLNRLAISGNSSASNISFATGNINLSGDLDVSGFLSTTAGSTLTGTITFTGTGIQTFTGEDITAGAAKLPNIIINKSGGSLSFGSENISIAGAFTYTAGTVDMGTSTAYFFGTKNISCSGLTFNNVNIGHPSFGSASSTLTSGMLVGGNLTINTGSTLNTGGQGLTVQKDVTNSGTFTPGNSAVTFSGANNQAIDFRNSTDITIQTLIVNKQGGTATINDTMTISDLLTSTSGALNANNRIKLQSTSSKTAQVGPVGGTLAGNFIIQRFIPAVATAKWRFIAAPVTSTSNATIRNSWQSNMFITGAGSGTGPVGLANYNSNGFDWTLSNNPSMYTYNENQASDFNSRWTAITSTTSTSLTGGLGYRAFIRGDRSSSGRLDGSVSAQNAATLTVTGNLMTGNQTLNTTCSNGCTSNDGWNLLGNPFAATFDWEAVSRNNIDATVYIYNPTLNLYSTYTAGGSGTNGGSNYLSSGQAFFVKCNSSSGGSLTIEETDKSTGNANDLYKTGSVANELRVLLSNPANTVKDEIVAGFHSSATKLFDGETDAYKMGNTFGTISSTTSALNTLLAVNKIKLNQGFGIDTIILNVNLKSTTQQTYSLNFSGVSSFQSGTGIYLYDHFLNTLVDLASTPEYTFITTADTNSYGKRFELYFGNLNPLSVEYKTMTALNKGNSVDVQWTTLMENNMDGFQVERSNDGVTFTSLGFVKGHGNSTTEVSYHYVDQFPLNGSNYYRLKQIRNDGQSDYSKVVMVDFTTGIREVLAKTAISVYPIPASKELNLYFDRAVKGDIKVNIVDPFGSLISTRIISAGAPDLLKQDISGLKSGVYFMEITTSTGIAEKVKFIKD